MTKIDLNKFYENEINFKQMFNTNSEINETESLMSFPETHRGLMNDASSSNFNPQFDYITEDYNMGFPFPPREKVITPIDLSTSPHLASPMIIELQATTSSSTSSSNSLLA